MKKLFLSFLSITIIFTLISCKVFEDILAPPQYKYKYSFVSYSLLNGSKKLIKEDIIPPYYFVPVKSEDGNDRLFFFGSNCGYYDDPDSSPTYFNFKSYNILFSKRRNWIIFQKYDMQTGDGNFFILNTSTLQIREINTKLPLYYYENNYGYGPEKQNYSFSPDETKLVLSDSITFSEKDQLYIMDNNTLTAGKILEIKNDNYDRIQFLSPVFSSDASKIFFSISYPDGFSAGSINPKPGLYSINSDGTSLTPIDTVESSIQIIRPAWSGKLIFYIDNKNKFYKINEDGTGKINVGISYYKGPIEFRVSSSGSTIIWWNVLTGEGKNDYNIYLNDGLRSISIDEGFIVEFSQDENSVEYIQMFKL